MKKIAIAMLAILIAKSCLSQIEIAIQAGPSINSLAPDQELAEFYSESGTNTGILFGYSAGAIASIRKGMAIAKSGILIDSRGGSYCTNTMAVMTDETGAQKSTSISLDGYSRLGYITMPLSIGFEIGKKARLGMDIGGFLSIPISEYHETTYEGTSSEFNPMFPIGRDAGFMANACAKIPLSNSISLSTDFRYLHGMADAMGKGQIGQSFSRSFQILGGLTISIGR